MKLYTLLLLCAISQLLSCRQAKEKYMCNPKRRIDIPQRVLDYFYFKTGTYWVYQNQLTQELDSHYVAYSYFGTKKALGYSKYECSCYNNKCYQNVSMSIESKTRNLNPNSTSKNTRFDYVINVNDYFSKDYSKTNFMFILEAERASYYFYSNGKWELESSAKPKPLYFHKDTSNVTIAVINYNECIKDILTQPLRGIILSNYSSVIMARNIGLVSYIINDDTTNAHWNLIRSHIIQ
jgi:hypothetical protein